MKNTLRAFKFYLTSFFLLLRKLVPSLNTTLREQSQQQQQQTLLFTKCVQNYTSSPLKFFSAELLYFQIHKYVRNRIESMNVNRTHTHTQRHANIDGRGQEMFSLLCDAQVFSYLIYFYPTFFQYKLNYSSMERSNKNVCRSAYQNRNIISAMTTKIETNRKKLSTEIQLFYSQYSLQHIPSNVLTIQTIQYTGKCSSLHYAISQKWRIFGRDSKVDERYRLKRK